MVFSYRSIFTRGSSATAAFLQLRLSLPVAAVHSHMISINTLAAPFSFFKSKTELVLCCGQVLGQPVLFCCASLLRITSISQVISTRFEERKEEERAAACHPNQLSTRKHNSSFIASKLSQIASDVSVLCFDLSLLLQYLIKCAPQRLMQLTRVQCCGRLVKGAADEL